MPVTVQPMSGFDSGEITNFDHGLNILKNHEKLTIKINYPSCADSK